MKRAALFLLALTACADPAPKDGVRYQGALSIEAPANGDTVPFELPAGAFSVFANAEGEDPMACAYAVRILELDSRQAVATISGEGTESYTLRTAKDGWYYATSRASAGGCELTLDIMPAD